METRVHILRNKIKGRRSLADYLFEKQRGLCEICHDPIKKSDRQFWNIDHIIPKSKGGRWEIDNLQVTHRECNTQKGNNLFDAKTNV